MQQTEATPWYPTARLFRQSIPGDWAGLVERVIEELRELSAARSKPAQSIQTDSPAKQVALRPRFTLA